MSVYVFTGPSISADDAGRELPAVYLAPAAEGDVYRIAQQHPRVIAIIDGYFQSVPSVQHKEILWAMAEGIHVFGAASMGALRAAELAPFGMEGVGKIFRSYRDGILEDDDEVAVAHSDTPPAYTALSEAMVNMRATLRAAEHADVILPDFGLRLEGIAKQLFYPDRSYAELFRCAAQEGGSEDQLRAFREWLPRGGVNLKRQDATAMLRVIRKRLRSGLPRKVVRYSFAYTSAWHGAVTESGPAER